MTDLNVARVKEFFAGNAASYDAVVRLTTFGNDRVWKERIVQVLSSLPGLQTGPTSVLDLACGTGILTFAVADKVPRCRIVGVDMTAEYLRIAGMRAEERGDWNIEFVHSRAEEFATTERFDAIISSYLAKYADLDALTRSAASMLRPGGILLMHEFTYPENPLVALAWRGYFPILRWFPAKHLRQWRAAFRGLPRLVRETSWISDLMHYMQQYGFTGIRMESLGWGTSAIVMGQWP